MDRCHYDDFPHSATSVYQIIMAQSQHQALDQPISRNPTKLQGYPDNKINRANMGPIWGRQDSGGPHVCPMNFAILVVLFRIKVNDIV